MSAVAVGSDLHRELILKTWEQRGAIFILGGGPSGLLAAHAVRRAGFDPILYDQFPKRPPHQSGVYLHDAIPGVTTTAPDCHVEFAFKGSASEYAVKVYGADHAVTSWDRFAGPPQPGWEFNEAMRRLWVRHGPSVYRRVVDRRSLERIKEAAGFVISTIPAPLLCDGSHDFHAAHQWIRPNELPPGVELPSPHAYLYSGDMDDPWTRCGRLFGHKWTEYGVHTPGCVPGQKPIGNDCDCHPEILRVGRFGRWERGVLLTDSFKQVTELFEEAGREMF